MEIIMNKDILTFLVASGVIFISTIVFFIIIIIKNLIHDCIKHFKWEYKYKHRFDKSPTAKCYCKDCKYYCENGDCMSHRYWKVNEAWFCWAAEPRKYDPEDKNKQDS